MRWLARSVRSASSSLALWVLSSGVLAKENAGADWPQFLGPHANGISDETGLLNKWPTNGPPIIWDKQIGTGYGAPSVRGSLLVLHHRIGDEEIIESFDTAAGNSVWRYAYPSHFIDPYGYSSKFHGARR